MEDKEFYKRRIYEIIEMSKENDKVSRAYDVMITYAVVVGLIPLTMKADTIYTRLIDLVTVLIFLVDYILRIYTSDYKMGVKSYKAYIAYCLTPMAIIDALSLLPILSFFFPASIYFGLFRMFRVARIFKLIRYSKTMINISNVMRRVKKQLFAVLVLTLIYITASAMIIFQIEPDMFESFADALYWATISITTIGYGDYAPVTMAGRFVTMISALVGVGVIALPSGIITAAYVDEIKKKKSKLEL